MINARGRLIKGPYVVREGLVLYLDAANTKSYPGTGTTWTDLSGNGYVGTLHNSPGYSTQNGGGIVFDGTDDYVDLNSNNLISGNNPFTFECFYRLNAVGSGSEIFGNYGAGYLSSSYIWISGEYGVYIGGSVYFPGAPIATPGVYHMAVSRTSGNLVKLYRNNVEVNSGTLTGNIAAGPNFRIGSDTNNLGGVGGERLNGSIFAMRLYNRVLTTTELTYNYNSIRARFGF